MNRINLVSAHSADPTPDLIDLDPSGRYAFISLRGSLPLSGDPHVSTGSSPGLMIVEIKDAGKDASVRGIVPIHNFDAQKIDHADPHGIRVRVLP